MRTTQRRRVARWGGAALLVLAPLPWLGVGAAAADPGQRGNADNITICHRTNAVNNPYVMITVAPSSVDGNLSNDKGRGDHFAEHTGPVFDPSVDYTPPMSGDEWGDIIPPIAGVHAGLNWTDAGQAIYDNGCKVPSPTVTESSSSPAEVTSSPASDKVTLCHATASVKNPYVVITVAVSAADGDLSNDHGRGDHYAQHTGPIFDPAVDTNGGGWGDIIPPISGVHDGLNWTDAGQTIFDAGCKFASVSPTETESSSSPEVKPTETSSSPEVKPSGETSQPEVKPSHTSKPPVSVKPTRLVRPGELPHTGNELPVSSALMASLLLIVLGGLLLVGPGRLTADRYHKRH